MVQRVRASLVFNVDLCPLPATRTNIYELEIVEDFIESWQFKNRVWRQATTGRNLNNFTDYHRMSPRNIASWFELMVRGRLRGDRRPPLPWCCRS